MIKLGWLDIIKLSVSVFISLMAGVIGSVYTGPAIDTWYRDLNKPIFNPPDWVFAPVWTILYLLIGVAAFLVWRRGLNHPYVKIALALFIVQLGLNAFWSYVFFGLQNPLAAFFEIIVLWTTIAATIFYFYKVSPAAAYLLLPYIFWITFAAILNFSIFQIN